MEAEIDAELKTWGNSYGILVPVDVARRLGLEPGTRVHVTLEYEKGSNDPDALPSWDFGGDYDIDKIIAEELE